MEEERDLLNARAEEAGEIVVLGTVREYRAARSIPSRLEFPNQLSQGPRD